MSRRSRTSLTWDECAKILVAMRTGKKGVWRSELAISIKAQVPILVVRRFLGIGHFGTCVEKQTIAQSGLEQFRFTRASESLLFVAEHAQERTLTTEPSWLVSP